MPQKNAVNGFWLFAQSNKSKWKAQGLIVATPAQLLGIANPLWKSLTVEERKKWDDHAKEERKRRRMEDGEGDRLDNTGHMITMRRDPLEERRLQREREIACITEQWQDIDLTEEKFYLISFQELCETTPRESLERRQWLPREMALIQFTLSKGITQVYHQFIWPGSIPLGYRLDAEKKSEDTHQIPAEEMEEDSHDYAAICKNIMRILSDSMKQGQYPPVYCLDKDFEKTRYLCDWLWYQSGVGTSGPSPLARIYCLEDLVKQLFSYSGNPDAKNVAVFQIATRLEGSQWDYDMSASCDFHEKVDVSRACALAIVKKYAYTMADMLAMHYNIRLSEKHVPVYQEKETPAVPPMALPPAVSTVGRGRGSRKSAVKQAIQEKASGVHTPLSQQRRQERERHNSDNDDNDDDKRLSHTSQGFGWPQSSPCVVERVPRTAAAPPGSSVAGQFTDMPVKDTVASDSDEEDYPPAVQMSNLSLSGTPAVWKVGRGGGIVVPPAVPAVVRPPPGFAAVNPVGGRGISPEGAWVRSSAPVGRGARPAAGQAQAMGRGVAVGGGPQPLPAAAPAVSFGRGRMPDAGRGPGGSYCEAQGPAGVSFGRGYSLGPSPASPAFPAPGVGCPGSHVDTDSFPPASLNTDYSSPFGGGGDGARGVDSGAARGVMVGRGMMVRGGRGFMPRKGVSGGEVH